MPPILRLCSTAIADDVHQILTGTKPERIPVVQPTKFEFSVNLNTVQALGRIVPPALIAAADLVIAYWRIGGPSWRRGVYADSECCAFRSMLLSAQYRELADVS